MTRCIEIPTEKLKEMSLKDRLIATMTVQLTDFYFAMGVIDILVDQNPHKHVNEMDINIQTQIREMLTMKESAFNAYWALKEIYESEYEDIEDMDVVITKTAKSFAEDALKARHWK